MQHHLLKAACHAPHYDGLPVEWQGCVQNRNNVPSHMSSVQTWLTWLQNTACTQKEAGQQLLILTHIDIL